MDICCMAWFHAVILHVSSSELNQNKALYNCLYLFSQIDKLQELVDRVQADMDAVGKEGH